MPPLTPHLSWRQLTTFHTVAREHSFSRAARKLFLSQPAVSAQIRDLEAYFGVKLFDRLGRRIFLTQAGEVLLEYVQRMINIAEEATQSVEELKGLKRGQLCIGASLLVGSYMLPPLLGEFKKEHRGTAIELRIRFAPEVARLVAENRVDIGLVGSPVAHPSLATEPIRDDELVVIIPGTHPWADRSSITPREFCSQPAIFTEEGSSTRRVALRQLSRHGYFPNITLELGHTEAVKRAVESGLGVSIISANAVQSEVDSGRLKAIHLKGINLRRNISLLYHRDKSPSNLVRAFLIFLQKAWDCEVEFLHKT